MQVDMLHPAEQLAIIMKRIYDRDLTSSKGGNLSIRDEEGNIWITPGGIDKQSLTKEDIICITPNGKTIGRHKPSVELPFHKMIYEAGEDIQAVLHAHSPELVMFSLLRKSPEVRLLPDLDKICDRTGVAEYGCPGSRDLGERIKQEFLRGKRQVILENHGVCVGGGSLIDVFKTFEAYEQAARIQKQAKYMGEVSALTEEQLEQFKNSYLYEGMGSFRKGFISVGEKEARRTVCRVAGRAYRKKLIFNGLGAVSQRTGEDAFVIIPEAGDVADLSPEELVAVDGGNCEEGKKANPYAALHRKIYKENPKVGGIITAQPSNLMAFAITGKHMDSLLIPETFVLLHDIPNISYEEALEAPEQVAKLVGEGHPLIIMDQLGVLMAGSDAFDAFVSLEVAEDSAYGITASRAMGTIKLISGKDVEDIKKAFHME